MDATTTKRKSTASQEDETFRPVKRRASKACQSCRARKVRCDVVLCETSCTNCKLDDIACVVPTSRKCRSDTNKKRTDTDRTEGRFLLPTTKSNKTLDEPAVTPSRGPYLSPVSEVTGDGIPVCTTFDCEETEGPSNVDEESCDFRGPPPQQSPSTASLSASTSLPSPSTALCLPPFIKPLSGDIDVEDLEYLRCKGAFEMPSGDLLVDIIQAYMSGVHVLMPVLDMRQILQAIATNDTQHRISLLVFQAMVFAGMAHLPGDCLHKTGQVSVKEARKACFTRVQLLYDFDTEQDDMSLLQALLLMSFVYEKGSKRRHTWYWTGLALSHAQTLGLDRNPSAASLSPETQALHKRLWWSLYIRDRLIGLGLRRPIRFRDNDFDVPPLAVNDFDTSPFQFDLPTPYGHVTIRQDSETANLLAIFCVEVSRLCVCISHILSTQYTVLAQRTMMMRPRPFEQRSRHISRCCEELRDWFEVLDPKLRPFALDRGRDISKACSEIHWPILHMIYRTAIIVLHRPNMLPQHQTSSPQVLQGHALSREKVKAAACTLTSITQTIYRQGHVHMLPTTGVTALLAATLAHLSTIKSADDDTRDASAYRFSQSIQVLQQLQKVYDSADSTVAFLAITLRKSGLDQQTALQELQTTGLLPLYAKPRSESTSHHHKYHHSASPSQLKGPNMAAITSTPPTSTIANDDDTTLASCIDPSLATIPSSLTTAHSKAFRPTEPDNNNYNNNNVFQDMFSTWVDDTSVGDMMAFIDPNFDYDADSLRLWDT